MLLLAAQAGLYRRRQQHGSPAAPGALLIEAVFGDGLLVFGGGAGCSGPLSERAGWGGTITPAGPRVRCPPMSARARRTRRRRRAVCRHRSTAWTSATAAGPPGDLGPAGEQPSTRYDGGSGRPRSGHRDDATSSTGPPRTSGSTATPGRRGHRDQPGLAALLVEQGRRHLSTVMRLRSRQPVVEEETAYVSAWIPGAGLEDTCGAERAGRRRFQYRRLDHPCRRPGA